MNLQTPEQRPTTGAAHQPPAGTCSSCVFWQGERDYSVWRQCALDGEQTEPQTSCGAFEQRQEGGPQR